MGLLVYYLCGFVCYCFIHEFDLNFILKLTTRGFTMFAVDNEKSVKKKKIKNILIYLNNLTQKSLIIRQHVKRVLNNFVN